MTNKDLISQYVDTGLKIPPHQFMKLSNQDIKTYVRKRLIAHKSGGDNISDDEFHIFSEKDKMEFAEVQINRGLGISDKKFELFAPENKLAIATKYAIKKRVGISDKKFESLLPKDREKLVDVYRDELLRIDKDMFELISPEARIRYVLNMADSQDGVSYLLSMVPKEVAEKYVLKRAEKGRRLMNYEIDLLPLEIRRDYLIKKFDTNPMGIFSYLKDFSPKERFQIAIKLVDNRIGKIMDLDLLLPEDRVKYMIKLAENAYNLEKNQFDLLPPKNKMDYISKMSRMGRPMINIEIFNSLPIDVKKQYVLKQYKNGHMISSEFVQYLPPEIRNKQDKD